MFVQNVSVFWPLSVQHTLFHIPALNFGMPAPTNHGSVLPARPPLCLSLPLPANTHKDTLLIHLSFFFSELSLSFPLIWIYVLRWYRCNLQWIRLQHSSFSCLGTWSENKEKQSVTVVYQREQKVTCLNAVHIYCSSLTFPLAIFPSLCSLFSFNP